MATNTLIYMDTRSLAKSWKRLLKDSIEVNNSSGKHVWNSMTGILGALFAFDDFVLFDWIYFTVTGHSSTMNHYLRADINRRLYFLIENRFSYHRQNIVHVNCWWLHLRYHGRSESENGLVFLRQSTLFNSINKSPPSQSFFKWLNNTFTYYFEQSNEIYRCIQ